MAKITGTAASTASPAILRRRPKMILTSERRNRVESRARGGLATTASSAADIESLARQGHEYIFQTGLQHGEPEHRHARIDEVGHDLFDRYVTQCCGDIAG